MRILNSPRRGIVSGYFTKPTELCIAGGQYSGHASGVYVTLNPIHPDLLARAANRVIEWAKHTTSDADILHLLWLLVDFDPDRRSGISSTDAEHEAVLQRARECRAWLQSLGWPAPVLADSGNGAHLLAALDLPNDPASTSLLKQCLEALDLQCSDQVVHVDRTTYNASQLGKLYGTQVRKGDPLPDRPHRLSRLLDVPVTLEVVPRAQLAQLAAMVPPRSPGHSAPRSNAGQAFDLEQWIATHQLPVVQQKPWRDGRIWILNPCPWNAEHTNRSM